MATIFFASILIVASAFMFYALLKFHNEAARARRRASPVSEDVIVMRRNRQLVSLQPAERRRTFTGELLMQLDRADSGEATDVLPFGVKRLAMKRAVRS
jgi:hypothetical protein